MMRAEEIQVGKTYEGGNGDETRRVIANDEGYTGFNSSRGGWGIWCLTEAFARWAVREVPNG